MLCTLNCLACRCGFQQVSKLPTFNNKSAKILAHSLDGRKLMKYHDLTDIVLMFNDRNDRVEEVAVVALTKKKQQSGLFLFDNINNDDVFGFRLCAWVRVCAKRLLNICYSIRLNGNTTKTIEMKHRQGLALNTKALKMTLKVITSANWETSPF